MTIETEHDLRRAQQHLITTAKRRARAISELDAADREMMLAIELVEKVEHALRTGQST